MTEPWSTSSHHTIMATRMHMPPSIMHLPNMPWIRHTMHISNPTNQPPSPRTQTLKCQYINLSIIMTKFPLKLPSQTRDLYHTTIITNPTRMDNTPTHHHHCGYERNYRHHQRTTRSSHSYHQNS